MYLQVKYLNFSIANVPYKKEAAQLKQFLEDLALLIIKNHMPVTSCGKSLAKEICIAIKSSDCLSIKKTQISQDILPTLV
jgi:hypothetical protein